MKNYNLVIIEDKQCSPFLNLTQQAFYDKLWEWTWEYDLWDALDENDYPDDIPDIIYQFINDNMLHKYEDDEIDCFAFVNDDIGIVEYKIDDDLIDFVKSKIEEHYD